MKFFSFLEVLFFLVAPPPAVLPPMDAGLTRRDPKFAVDKDHKSAEPGGKITFSNPAKYFDGPKSSDVSKAHQDRMKKKAKALKLKLISLFAVILYLAGTSNASPAPMGAGLVRRDPKVSVDMKGRIVGGMAFGRTVGPGRHSKINGKINGGVVTAVAPEKLKHHGHHPKETFKPAISNTRKRIL
ncbi:hypothetical protein DFJ73DRAFT_776915 [Zopfochytrium polystomum]|nr:hypothetical protein DFJ73DRAFT_776915 [Zopfochytrium polystomum]